MSDDAESEAGRWSGDASGAEAAADGGEAVEETSGPLSDVAVWHYLRLGATGLLALLAVLATIQLYTNTSAAIARWVSPDYVPVFQAAFNLVVLLLALAGLAVLARRR